MLVPPLSLLGPLNPEMLKVPLVAEWCPDAGVASVPPLIVDSVVAVPVHGSPGDVFV